MHMKEKTDEAIRVVDKRRTLAMGEPEIPRAKSSGRRDHAVLLGYFNSTDANKLFESKGLDKSLVEELLHRRAKAEERIKILPPLVDPMPAALPIADGEAVAEIKKVMELPDCRQMYPAGTWTVGLLEISKLIPLQPHLDVAYAESLGPSDLSASRLLSAVKLCFSHRGPTSFGLNVDESQKSITITSINPMLQVRGVQCGQQEQDGPFAVSLLISGGPNVVQVSQIGGRRFLVNGYHRVYRMMKAGFSHVPCVIREASALPDNAGRGSGFFRESALTAPRPPLFSDFADEVLGIIVPFPAMTKVIRIRPDEYSVVP
jgi:hypothetical protein